MTPAVDRYCRWLANYFFIDGLDRDDLYQEAWLAAWLAPGLERLAARRRIIELLRRSQRGGRPRFVELVEAESSRNIIDIVETRERLRAILSTPLSDLERVALGRSLRGESCGERHLDNARQRALEKVSARLAA